MSQSKNEPRGLEVLQNPALNKATAFTHEERERYGLRGLLPPAILTQELQLARSLENLRRKESDIERFIFLQALLGRNERLFYRLVREHIDEILPLIYTPTVGQACKEFAHIFRQPRGLYVTAEDRGEVATILANWPHDNVRVIVVTDGERILGLGDLGANGMGIPIGKLTLYTALAGIDPMQTLPVMFDVGTNNEALRADPLYLGLRQPRLRGDAYFELFDEFVAAVKATFPDALLQFEDFATPNAYAILRRYRDTMLCFNDDIQGTAAMALAGVIASTRISGIDFRELRVM
ncbi:MAG TPA: oxaloacetate-decarboxylating malate dehydrogenase, partial [Gammaproteobacteria bacterium]|nr:oxaloacetate-decarboxylating malate dehydrogenase [Gammaproteobacteria bacterium]